MNSTSNDVQPEGYKMTELRALPKEWEVVRLGEVADIVMGQSPPGSSYNETGVGLPFLQGKAEFGPLHPLHIKYTTTPIKIAPKDSVLLSVRAPVGDVNLANIDYCIGRGLASISLSSGKNIFLFYILTYLKNEIEKEGTGSIFKAINKTKLFNFQIPLPPLSEQQKIAAVLSAVQEAKEKTEAVIAATKALKKSMMKHLFTYGPVSLQETERVRLKETEIGPVPEEWEVVRLGEITKRCFGGGTPSTSRVEYWNGNIPWTTSAVIGEEDIFLKKFQKTITEIGLESSSTNIAPKESLLVGTRVGVGKAVVAKFDISINQDLTAIELYTQIALPTFIAYFFKTKNIQRWFENNKRGATIKGIPRKDLLNILIPLPPLPTQQKIASILSAIDAKIEAEENKKQALEELFKSLLHNLMTAKIRVNQLEVTL